MNINFNIIQKNNFYNSQAYRLTFGRKDNKIAFLKGSEWRNTEIFKNMGFNEMENCLEKFILKKKKISSCVCDN